MDSWKQAIDEAVKLCGSQRKLASHLGIDEAWMSKGRSGKQPLSDRHLTLLAELLKVAPAHLWELQEVAYLPKRNPFLQAVGAALSVFLCVVLSAGQNDANAATARASGSSQRLTSIHIVDLSLRGETPGERLARVAAQQLPGHAR